MNSSLATSAAPNHPRFVPDGERDGGNGWLVREVVETSSTNLLAAQFPLWHAVRADTQTAGRGRFQREWISDRGGLWLSAVVPVETNSPGWRLLPLVAGLALCEVLRNLGVSDVRLRWPNDVLVERRKLAGLLIDQFQAGRAVVGIGLNVANQPENRDLKLAGQVTRLAELISYPPSLRELTDQILVALRTAWLPVWNNSPAPLLPRIHGLWQLPRRVAVDLDGPIVSGEFHGVDAAGCLLLRDDAGRRHVLEPQNVRLLRDLY